MISSFLTNVVEVYLKDYILHCMDILKIAMTLPYKFDRRLFIIKVRTLRVE